jgi:hypothetical protein
MHGCVSRREPEISGKYGPLDPMRLVRHQNHMLIIQDKSPNISLMLDNAYTRKSEYLVR